jgi:cardiolipin synthase
MNVRTAATVVGGAAALGVAGTLLWRAATRHEQDKEGNSPGVRTYDEVGGNDARLLVGYDKFVPSVLADLRAAKDVINVAEYNWEPTGPSGEIAEILKAKARAGVDVNVTTDKRGSFGVDSNSDPDDARAYFDDLEAAGVHVIVSDPGGNAVPFGLFLDHRKLFDIDHRVAYVGGFGLAGGERGKYDNWHDMMLRVEGPAAAQAGQEFLHHWQLEGGTVSPKQLQAFGNATPVANASDAVRFLPNTPGEGLDATDDFFEQAKAPGTRLWVMTPYIGDEGVQKALIAASKAGKDVRVLVPSPESGSNGPQLHVSRAFYRDMINAGVRVFEYPTMMHAKAWLSDDQFTVGSTNLSDGALDEYLELSAAVRNDPEMLDQVETMLEQDFDKSREVQPDEFGFKDRAIETFRDLTNLEF